MQEREAKLLYSSNDLETVIIERADEKAGWTISLVEKNATSHYLVSKRGTEARVFKTSDAALRCCARIGFNQVEVRLKS